MTEPGEFGAACGHFHQGAARARLRLASQHLYEHPWGTKAHTATKLLRPRAIRNLYGEDGLAHRNELMDQADMQAFPMGREFALAGSFAPSGGQIPLAVLPRQALLATLLDAPTRIVVVRVVGPALAV